MGLFTTITTGISNACSAIGAAIGGACRAVGGAISSFCKTIGIEKIGNVAEKFFDIVADRIPIMFENIKLGDVIDAICKVVGAIAEALGLKKPKEDEPEDLGLKAEAAEKKPEEFDDTEAYINYLHNEIKLDIEKKKNLSPEEKAVYKGIGNALYLEAAKEKLGVDEISPEFLIDAVKLKMEASEILAYINKLKEEGINDQKDMSKYLNRQASANSEKVQDCIIEAIKELNPEMSENDIADKIIGMKNTLNTED